MIEQLPKSRWHELDWSRWGGSPPNGTVRVYFDGDKILGWYLIERGVTHVGPFEVMPAHRGNGIGNMLAQDAHDLLGSDFYVAALNKQTEHMCERFGMTRIEGVLYSK